MMAILNYTTSISADKTAMEIQAMLVKAKASAVMSEYEGGILARISFKVTTIHGEHAFQLPANVDGVFTAMKRDSRVTGRLKTKDQAARVAWRIVKDWVEAQLAIIEADMATLPQVFLPYMQIGPDETVYSRFEKKGFPALSAPTSHREGK
jgi:hypothetical protein